MVETEALYHFASQPHIHRQVFDLILVEFQLDQVLQVNEEPLLYIVDLILVEDEHREGLGALEVQ